MSERFCQLVRGFFSNLKFSNCLWLTYNRLFRRNARAITYIWKNRLYIVCDCAHSDHISVQEIFADRAYDQFLTIALPQRGDIRYVNVGANIGAFDLMLFDSGRQIQSGLAVELNPYTFQRCLLNLQTNSVPNTTVVNCGVADRDDFIDFVPSSMSLGDNIFGKVPDALSSSAQRVELVSLETLLQRHGGNTEQFDLLKLDCEGAEYPVLKNAPAVTLQRFQNILIEFHPAPRESVTAAYEKLAGAGFSSYRRTPPTPPFVDLFTRDEGETGKCNR